CRASRRSWGGLTVSPRFAGRSRRACSRGRRSGCSPASPPPRPRATGSPRARPHGARAGGAGPRSGEDARRRRGRRAPRPLPPALPAPAPRSLARRRRAGPPRGGLPADAGQAAEAIAAEGLSAQPSSGEAWPEPFLSSAAPTADPAETRLAFGEDLEWGAVAEAIPDEVARIDRGADHLDPFALDGRMRRVVEAMQRVDWQTG